MNKLLKCLMEEYYVDFFLLKEIEREAKKLGMFANNLLGLNRSGVIKLYNGLVKLLNQVNKSS